MVDSKLYERVERWRREAADGHLKRREATEFQCGLASGEYQAFSRVLSYLEGEDEEERKREAEDR